MLDVTLAHSPLGKKTAYETIYNPNLLFPVPRQMAREGLQLTGELPFMGVDVWTAYEISWLDLSGKPHTTVAEVQVPATSTNLIESKALKLYLNSFKNSRFKNPEAVRMAIQNDLSKVTEAEVTVEFILPEAFAKQTFQELPGICLDNLPVDIDIYHPTAELLTAENIHVNETLHTHLFASNCPITGQPDWASVLIRYEGKKITHENLLKYLISFREHTEFHEFCAERIFLDISKHCAPEKLTIYLRYTRRGGIDINPFRSNFQTKPDVIRCFRQ